MPTVGDTGVSAKQTKMTEVFIFHNPHCGTSRNVLAMIRNAGIEPIIIEYLHHPPSRERLLAMIAATGQPACALLREKGTPYHELGLDDAAKTDDELIDAMLAYPILINRPLLVTPLGTRLCRPSEVVLDLLPQAQRGAFIKEDGEQVIVELPL